MSCSPFSCLSLSKFRCLFFFPHLPRMCGKLNVPTKHVLDTSISIWFCFPSKPIRSIEQVSSRFNVPYKENMQAPQAAIIIPFYLHMAVKKQMKNICRRRIICIQLRSMRPGMHALRCERVGSALCWTCAHDESYAGISRDKQQEKKKTFLPRYRPLS